jgi:hypothetical protein
MFSFNPVSILLVFVMCALLGCELGTKPPPIPTPPKSRVAAPPPLPEPVRAARPSNLDEALNLLPSDERLHGFLLPMGAEAHANGRARKIRTTLPRLLRFYHSRDYQIIRQKNGSLYDPAKRYPSGLKGSDYKVQNVDPRERQNILHISARPGSNYLLRFETRGIRHLEQPALLRVLDAEREGLKEEAGRKPIEVPRVGDSVVPVAKGAHLVYKRTKPRSLERFSVRSAKKRALSRRGVEGRSKNVSNRIYNWSGQETKRNFLD